MAFCKQCGADLNGANFCPSCGCAADGQVVAQQTTPVMDVRQRSINDMENMLAYFGAKQGTYDEFDKTQAEVEDRSSRTYGGWIIGAIICGLIGIFAQAPFFLVLTIAFVVICVMQNKKNKEQLAIVQVKLDELGTELAEYYTAYGYCPVGIEYVRPEVLRVLYDLIRKGRAQNPGDAINIYLADLQQEEMLRLQQEATAAAQETAKNSKEAAKAAKRSASYNTASFWLKR